MDLKGRTASTLQRLGLSLAEHYVMCAAGYRVTLPPDELVQFASVAFDHDPRGTASPQELTAALAHLEASELMTRLTAPTLRQETDRSASDPTPEVMEFYRVGDVDFTPRGYAMYRDAIRSIHGDEFLVRADAGFNIDPNAGRVDVYAATLDDCASLMDEIERGGDSYTGEERTRFIAREDPTPIGRWRPNRLVVRETGYHGVLHFLREAVHASTRSA